MGNSIPPSKLDSPKTVNDMLQTEESSIRTDFSTTTFTSFEETDSNENIIEKLTSSETSHDECSASDQVVVLDSEDDEITFNISGRSTISPTVPDTSDVPDDGHPEVDTPLQLLDEKEVVSDDDNDVNNNQSRDNTKFNISLSSECETEFFQCSNDTPEPPPANGTHSPIVVSCDQANVVSPHQEATVPQKNDVSQSSPYVQHRFGVGDMFWSRVGASPYWPSIVIKDLEGEWLRMKKHKGSDSNIINEYHVMFFGRPMKRGWVSGTHTIAYSSNGFAEVLNMVEFKMRSTNSKIIKSNLRKCITANGKLKIEWNEAIEDAKIVAKHERTEDRLKAVENLFNEASLSTVMTSKSSNNSLSRKRKCPSEDNPSSKIDDDDGHAKRKKIDEQHLSKIGNLSSEVIEKFSSDTSLSPFDLFQATVGSDQPLAISDHPSSLSPSSPSLNALASSSHRTASRRMSVVWSKMDQGAKETYRKKLEELRHCGDTASIAKSSEIHTNGKTYIMKFRQSKYQRRSSDKTNYSDLYEDIIDDEFDETASQSGTSSSGENNGVGGPSTAMLGCFKREACCLICEEGGGSSSGVGGSTSPLSDNTEESDDNGRLVKCSAICGRSFHVECMKRSLIQVSPLLSTSINSDCWKCFECSEGKHRCLICMSSDGVVVNCSSPQCGRHYHISCLSDAPSNIWPQTRITGHPKNQLICPAHMCHTCASDNPREPVMKYSKHLLRCIRCPTAYHSGDHCVAAGTVQITSSHIICPKHSCDDKSLYLTSEKDVQANQKVARRNHVNANWCFICSSGGSLICCDRCPASFHEACVNEEIPKGDGSSYYCDNCSSGRMPLYNEIVWVKLGSYRWWPAKVLHPINVPDNIERLSHRMAEFPIQFCGTHEYYWMPHSRCFLYEEGDSDKIPGSQQPSLSKVSGLSSSYNRGIREASHLFQALQRERKAREERSLLKQKHKPPPYSKLKVNKPYGDCPPIESDLDDVHICNCKVPPSSSTTDGSNEAVGSTGRREDEDVACGDSSSCLNRMLMTECSPATCPAGSFCQNRRFQDRLYPPMKVSRTANNRGWGLFTEVDVKAGQFVIEYVGELISMDEYRKRMEGKQSTGDSNYYFMGLDSNRMIDAESKANMARFMNHSCDPNCETQKWTVNGDTRVGLFALKNIEVGSELCFNYKLESCGESKKVCLCNARNCSGFIGAKAGKVHNYGGSATEDDSGSVASDCSSASRRKRKKKKIKRAMAKFNAAQIGSNIAHPLLPDIVQSTIPKSSTSRSSFRYSSNSPQINGSSQSPSSSSSCSSSSSTIISSNDKIILKISSPIKKEQQQEQSLTSSKHKSGQDSNQNVKLWEDYCFRCYEDGELLMCDFKSCPKVYHLACIGRTKMPREKWFCPWHHCVECGRSATSQCKHCPNAYCTNHDSVLNNDDTLLGHICDEHGEDVIDAVEFFGRIPGGSSHMPCDADTPLQTILQRREESLIVNENRGGVVEIVDCSEDDSITEDEHEEVDHYDSKLESKASTELDDFEDELIILDDDLDDETSNGQCDVEVAKSSVTTRKTSIRCVKQNELTKKCSHTTSILDESLIKHKSERSSTSPTPGTSCTQPDCTWRGRKYRLLDHLINVHKFSIDDARSKFDETTSEGILNSVRVSTHGSENNENSDVLVVYPSIPRRSDKSGFQHISFINDTPSIDEIDSPKPHLLSKSLVEFDSSPIPTLKRPNSKTSTTTLTSGSLFNDISNTTTHSNTSEAFLTPSSTGGQGSIMQGGKFNEMRYPCCVCYKNFRPSNLMLHLKSHVWKGDITKDSQIECRGLTGTAKTILSLQEEYGGITSDVEGKGDLIRPRLEFPPVMGISSHSSGGTSPYLFTCLTPNCQYKTNVRKYFRRHCRRNRHMDTYNSRLNQSDVVS